MKYIATFILSFLFLTCFVSAQTADSPKNVIRLQQTGNRCVFTLQDTTNIISSYWNFGDPPSGAANTASVKVVEHVFPKPGTYQVSVMIVYSTARSETLNTTVLVEDSAFKVTFPLVITPNGDNKNEDFGPEGPALVKCRLMIYNRWGSKLFDQESVNPRWDATSKGEPCADGTYFYVAEVSYYKDGSLIEEEIHGNVTVIREN